MKLLFKFPITAIVLCCAINTFSMSMFDLGYDSPGFRGLFFWVAQISELPFWPISEGLFILNAGKAVPLHSIIAAGSTLGLALLIDVVSYRLRKRH